MLRIRTVKPELFSHDGLFEAELEFKLPLRVAFIGLFTCCDREGRFNWNPRRLKLAILPYDEIDISSVFDALVERGFIKKYEHQGKFYGYIPSWHRHQYINTREAQSELPAPKETTTPKFENSILNNDMEEDDVREFDASVTGEARVPDASRACTRGKEGKGKELGRERKGSIVASLTRPWSEIQSIQKIFEHWKTVMNHPNANLDHKRKAMIGKALKFGYSDEQLCEAITGCSYTPHNIGENDRGQRYDGLHIILRDGDQIDRFIHNCQHPPNSISEAERRTKANVQTLQGWMSKTMAEEEIHARQ